MREFYKDIFGLTNEELLDYACSQSEIWNLKKGDMVIRAGEIQSKMFFLDQGVLRGYYINENGKDITDCFGICRGTSVIP